MGGKHLWCGRGVGGRRRLHRYRGEGEGKKRKKEKEATRTSMVKSGKESEGWCNRVDVDRRESVRANTCPWSGSTFTPRGIHGPDSGRWANLTYRHREM